MVSVIVVNYRGAERSIACLRGMGELAYPADKLEFLCVDNTADGQQADRIRAAVPAAKVIESPRNLGFAGGCNLAAQHAGGSVLALLNNDAVADPAWVGAAGEVLIAEPTVAAVASKVLDENGALVDFVDGGLTWFGMGYKRHAGRALAELEPGEHERAKHVLFGTGAAMFVRAGVFAEVGGFDERFFMFYEDVDLGWRLNLRGWRVRYAPDSLAYHQHHATMSEVDSAGTGRETFLLERNALAALYKNLYEKTLNKMLPAALALTVRRASARGQIDPRQLDLAAASDPGSAEPVPLPRNALAGVLAIDQFVDMLADLRPARAREQAARVRSDADLVPLLRKALEPAYSLPRYLAAHEALVDAFAIDEAFGERRKILVITGDAITERMAGPAIRAWNIASVLAGEHDVELVTVNPAGEPPPAPFPVAAANRTQLNPYVERVDIVILQGHVLEMAPALKKEYTHKIVVCDLYDPMHLEVLEHNKGMADDKRAAELITVTRVLDTQLQRGDFFLCASERQRHFWLGHLAALGRLSPCLYDADPTTQSLLAIAPFGLPAEPPVRTGRGIRGRFEGIGDQDRVVLWAGGIYSWFDPLTLLRALDQLRIRRPDVRLVFLGMRHPNPKVAEMDIATRTSQLADSLGLTDKHVFFNDNWVPYQQRQNWLLDADCGVTTHFEHVETTFAFRTRVLDYLWAGLPIVTTDGDSFAGLVRAQGLGVVVPAEDPLALAEALERCLYDTEFVADCQRRIAEVAGGFAWPHALDPLVRFCRDPHPAADRLPGARDLSSTNRAGPSELVRRNLSLIQQYLTECGVGELSRRVGGRLRRLAGRTRGIGGGHG